MAVSFMTAIEINRVSGEKAAHEFGKACGLCAFDQEVEMIGHQAKGVDAVFKER
jgi:hypothetical protein